ncbi:MAG: flotillin family protein [Ilumatobacteraceae bacterium]
MQVLFITAALVVFVLFAGGVFVTRLYRKVHQGQALIINRSKTTTVTFNGGVVLPVVHKAELMDIGVKVIEIEKMGNEGLICQDNIRADIRVSFYVRVNPTEEDVRKVAQLVGCVSASDPEKLDELFSAKFAEALKTAGKQMEFVQLYEQRERFRTSVIGVIGDDLNGYMLDDVAIEFLEQTPIEQLDPNNVLDAEGIKKITDVTSRENIQANAFRREAEKQIKAKDVETQQAVFEMERQEKAAEYRALREMATTKAREESLSAQVEAEERQKSESARLKTDEVIGIQQENMQREVQVAATARERVLAAEKEKVEKARQLEVVARDIETLSATKDLESEKARVAELAKARIAVEKTVAEQEESIKTLRVVEEANRGRDAQVIAAGAQAESVLITTIKEAEAKERASTHLAKERLTIAEAHKSASEMETVAKIRIAEGIRAEAAAEGLAEVEVQKASAAAIEQTGLAQVRVQEAQADATLKRGGADAQVARLTGEAEGAAMEARLRGEAAGLTEKAEAMKQLEGVGKEYDLAVRNIDADVQVRTASISAQKDAAIAQAAALGNALSTADINIVGGTDMFVDRILGATAMGKAVGGFADSSDATKAIAKPYLNGERDLIETLAGAVGGSQGLANLSLARFLGVLADRVGGDEGALLSELVTSLKDRGLDTISLNQLTK